jgi:hypothetical protein
VELRKDLLIPIITEAHDVIETKFLTLFNYLIEERVIGSLKVLLIHILARNNGGLSLAQNN